MKQKNTFSLRKILRGVLSRLFQENFVKKETKYSLLFDIFFLYVLR